MWSTEQEEIFQTFESTLDNLCISAAPGSGKTTLLRELWQRSLETSTLYLAFNKSIVEEARDKLIAKQSSDILTFNSLGAKLCYKAWKSKLNPNKCYAIIKEHIEHLYETKQRDSYKYALFTLVQYCKSNLEIRVLREPKLYQDVIAELIDYYDLDSYPEIEAHAARVLDISNKDTATIDFADQLLLPVLYDLEFPLYELILVDEAQDVNSIQREVLRRLLLRYSKSRIVLVGDPYQSIYAFRGALHNSIELLQEEFSCKNLPMTITFRCSKAVVEEAQKVYAEAIHAYKENQEGTVYSLENEELKEQRTLKPIERDYTYTIGEEFTGLETQDSFVLCRTMAPLISFAYQLLQNGIACQVKGRDIGKTFISYIRKSKAVYIADFKAYMDQDLGEALQDAYLKKDYAKMQRLQDKKDTLEVFCNSVKSLYVEDLVRYIENLFSSTKGILLSTIHRSKGLEAERVYILAPDLLPHPFAKQSWEKIQEGNIEYVAITRAKKELVYI